MGGPGAGRMAAVAAVALLATAARAQEEPTGFQPDPQICLDGGSGYFFPAFQSEHEWPVELRGFLYLVGLFWAFAGVAIIADIFMASIEKITSAEKVVTIEGHIFHVTVWNETVANLTLMALGSSAPEIILSTLEIVANGFFSGALGPSTIVGSAAFNLLVISAVCVVAIPTGEVRRIKELGVFAITAFFSVFAYLWLLVILVWSSPDVVEIWEGALTFLFFPALVYVAYLADRGAFDSLFVRANAEESEKHKLIQKVETQYSIRTGDAKKLDLGNMPQLVKRIKILNPNLTPPEVLKVAALLASHKRHKRSRAFYRVRATRALFGGKPIRGVTEGTVEEAVEKDLREHSEDTFHTLNPAFVDTEMPDRRKSSVVPAIMTFRISRIAVMESCGTLNLEVARVGNMDQDVEVAYHTEAITAVEGSHYHGAKGMLSFVRDQKQAILPIEIIDDDVYDEDKRFRVVLSLPSARAALGEIALGGVRVVEVTIIDDDQPGVLTFAEPTYTVWESEGRLDVVVVRQGGATGRMACQYETKDATAIGGSDYIPVSGELVFEHGEVTKTISIDIIDDDVAEDDETFQLILTDPDGAGKAVFHADTDGFEDREVVTITIKSDDDITSITERLLRVLNLNEHKVRLAGANWKQQFYEAVTVKGGEIDGGEDEDDSFEPPQLRDYLAHYITLPWKLAFALCPPVDLMGGWACFAVSLGMIALVTMIISDLASLFGCVCGLNDAVTAITFVALGTSLPDTFASMAAAVQDPTADASIGNITGSNSVNVFLGLGMPWLIASIYWRINGVNDEWRGRYPDISQEGFVVIAGDLGLSVSVFVGCSVACLGTLLLRRYIAGGELGGNYRAPTAVFFVTLWMIYIVVSSLKTEGNI